MTHESKISTASQKAYRVLLKSYPKDFRKEYGPHMEQVFRDLLREQRYERKLGFTKLWIRTLTDLMCTVIGQRGRSLMTSKGIKCCGLAAMAGGALMVAIGVMQAYPVGRVPGPGASFYGSLELFRSIGTLLLVGGLAGVIILIENQGRVQSGNVTGALSSQNRRLSLAQGAAVAGVALAGIAAVGSVALIFTDGLFGSFSLEWLSLLLATLLLGFAARKSGAMGRWRFLPLALGTLMLFAPIACFSLTLLVQEFYPDAMGAPYAIGVFMPIALPHILMGFAWIFLGYLLLFSRSGHGVTNRRGSAFSV